MTIQYFALRLTAWYRRASSSQEETWGVWRCYATKRHVWMNHQCKVKAGCTDVRMVDIEVTASDEIGLEEQWDIAPPHEE